MDGGSFTPSLTTCEYNKIVPVRGADVPDVGARLNSSPARATNTHTSPSSVDKYELLNKYCLLQHLNAYTSKLVLTS